MPENQLTLYSIVAAIGSTLVGTIGVLWKWANNIREKRDKERQTHLSAMESKDKAYLDKIEAHHKAMMAQAVKSHSNIATALDKSYSELMEMMKQNTADQLNGHAALNKEIDDITKKVTGLDKKVSLIEQQLKNK